MGVCKNGARGRKKLFLLNLNNLKKSNYITYIVQQITYKVSL